MNPQKKRMQDLLNQQHARIAALETIKAKTDLRAEMPLFDVKYRYAKPEESEKIAQVLEKIPFTQPGRVDTAKLSDAKQLDAPTYQSGKAWICFLCGNRAFFEVYVRGRVDDILRDLDTWREISPMLLLLLGDYRHLIFIDDNGSFTEAECPS